jgi:hypothetical protein
MDLTLKEEYWTKFSLTPLATKKAFTLQGDFLPATNSATCTGLRKTKIRQL